MSGPLDRLWYPRAPESALRRLALSPLLVPELAFRGGVALREWAYQRGWFTPARLSRARVISVGNLTVGGAGKTPVVIHLAERLARAGKTVAVVSRGYGRRSTEVLHFTAHSLPAPSAGGDEPLLIAQRCPAATVWVGPDKAELARRAEASGAEVVLIDDGLQTRRLARDLDVVVVDAGAAFGNRHLLPRGPLREPPSALSRAGLVWLKGEGEVDVLGRPWVRARHRPFALVDPEGALRPLDALAGKAVFPFAAIARPEAFARTAAAIGGTVAHQRWFPDHHFFTAGELAALRSEAGDAVLLTTEKDRVRLPPGFPAWAVRLEVELLEGEGTLAALLGG